MRIVCPSCAAVYDFADARLPASGRVRCAQCAHEWLAAPPAPPPTEAPPIEAGAIEAALVVVPPEPAPASPPPVSAPAAVHPTDVAMPPQARQWPAPLPPSSPVPLRRNRPVGVAWTISLLLVALLAAGAYAYRADIMRVWPPSARAYQLFGL